MSTQINEQIIEDLAQHLEEIGGSLDNAPAGMSEMEKIEWLVKEIKQLKK